MIVSHVLEAKYFPNTDFWSRCYELTLPSHGGLSGALNLLEASVHWKVGLDHNISIWVNLWIPGETQTITYGPRANSDIQCVSQLIDLVERSWSCPQPKALKRIWSSSKVRILVFTLLVVVIECCKQLKMPFKKLKLHHASSFLITFRQYKIFVSKKLLILWLVVEVSKKQSIVIMLVLTRNKN